VDESRAGLTVKSSSIPCPCACPETSRRSGTGTGTGRALTGGAVVVLAGLVLACSSGKREAASLVTAVDRFHKAENTEKPAAADYLATVPCTVPEVCQAKDACVKAAAATASALRLMSETQGALADLKANKLSPDDDRAKGLSAKLTEATRLLEEGHAAMPACDALVTKLKRDQGM